MAKQHAIIASSLANQVFAPLNQYAENDAEVKKVNQMNYHKQYEGLKRNIPM